MRDHLGGADLVGERRLERGGQHQQAGRLVGDEQALRAAPASSRSSDADRVDDGVLRRQLEHHGDVAELQVGVDQARPARSDRWARTTARLVAMTDLPAPPLVEKTVMTLPSSTSVAARRRARRRADRRRRPTSSAARRPAATRLGELRRCRPARRGRRGRRPAAPAGAASVVSSSATRMAPTLGAGARAAARRSPSSDAVGARRARAPRTTGTEPVSRPASSSIEANGVAPSPSCMASRLRAGVVGVDDGDRRPRIVDAGRRSGPGVVHGLVGVGARHSVARYDWSPVRRPSGP